MSNFHTDRGLSPAATQAAALNELSLAKGDLEARTDAIASHSFALSGGQSELETGDLVGLFNASDNEFFRKAPSVEAHSNSGDAIHAHIEEGNHRIASIEFLAEMLGARLAACEAVAEEQLAQYVADVGALNAAIAEHNGNAEQLFAHDNDKFGRLTLEPVTAKTKSCSPFSGYPESFRARRERVEYARQTAIAGIKRTIKALREALDCDGVEQ